VAAAAVDLRLRVAAAVGGERPRARRDEPDVGILGVDGDGPGVVAVTSVVGGVLRRAGVVAPRRSAAARLVRAPLRLGMPGERVDVGLRSRPVVLPGRAV
jgi:hypothetical protein